jgi:hypothetical protein
MAFKYLNDATIGAGQIVSNVLPTAANVAEGTFGYDSVVGPVYQKGGNWLAVSSNTFSPSVLTAAGIQAAMAAAGAAGGGIVLLPAQTIALSASLVPVSGVYLVGTQPVVNGNTNIPDSNQVVFTSGTILAPTGAFPAISWNTTVLGIPGSAGAFSALGLYNIGFKNLGFSGGTYGIFAGATNNASCWYSEFENLYFIGQSQWGLNITNYQHCTWRRIYSFNCTVGGQFHGIDVAGTTLQPGNSTYYDMYCNNASSLTSRSITFITTSSTNNGGNNEFKFDRIQSNRNGTASTQACTMTNAQATFTVTDGTKFAVGMPVVFSATANGFTTNLTYFVASVAANVISVATTYGGTAVNATGSTAVNITTQGFPCFEMIGLAGSIMTNAVIDNLDVEGGATVAVLFQNCNGFDVTVSQVPGTSVATFSVCGRSFVNSTLKSSQACNTDMDGSGPARAYWFYGSRNSASGSGNPGAGIWFDPVSGKAVMSLGGAFNSVSGGDLTFDPATSNGVLSPRNYGIGQLVKNVSGATYTVANLNLQFINSTSGTVITLPSVVAGNQGCWLEFFNTSGGSQTINTDGVQLFNGVAGRTSLTLNANASVRLSASGGNTWYIAGASSAMTAGVISAPT